MYRLNQNPGRRDTIHQEHTLEECNFDDALDREVISAERALELVAAGEAEYCEHCLPEGVLE